MMKKPNDETLAERDHILGVINPDRVPGMTRGIDGWDRVARPKWSKTKAFAVATNKNALQSSSLRDRLIDFGIALTYCLS